MVLQEVLDLQDRVVLQVQVEHRELMGHRVQVEHRERTEHRGLMELMEYQQVYSIMKQKIIHNQETLALGMYCGIM
jgi:hypothetical protein